MRLLVHHRVSSLVLVATLGLATGLGTALWSVLDTVLLRPLPYPEPDRLVAVHEAERGGRSDIRVADGNFPDLVAQPRTLASVAAYGAFETLITSGEATLRTTLGAATRAFFPALGAGAALGRLPAPEEHGAGAPAVTVLSDAFWRSAFGADPGVLGRRLGILGEEATIVGVLPPGFEFPRGTAVWVDLERFLVPSRTAHNLAVIARLAPGATLVQAQSELSVVARRLGAAHPADLGSAFDFAVRPLHEDLAGGARKSLFLLLGVVAAVLLIACGNVAGILFAWTLGRGRELAIRRSIGAGRRHLAAQLLAEGAVLGAIGSLLGLALAASSLGLLNSVVPPEFLHSGPIVLDGRLFAFALVLGQASGLLATLLPAWWIARHEPSLELRGAVSKGERRGRWGVGAALVVPQYAFSLAALAAAGLLLASLGNLLRVDPGFRTRGVVTVEVALPTAPPARYAEPAALLAFYAELTGRAAALDGVEAVTLAHALPLSGWNVNGVALREGQPMPGPDSIEAYPDYRVVGRGYFRTLGIPLHSGRDFGPEDGANSPPVAIVDRELARQLWGEGDPLGRRLVLPGLDFDREQAARPLTVVGVAPEVRHRGLGEAPRAAVYVPYQQHLTRAGSLHLVAAVRGRAERLVEPLRGLVVAQDPGLPPARARTMEGWVRESTVEPRFRTALLAGFAGLALVLAALGVYGVMSQAVARRRREMAIRLAVGARRWDVQRLILADGLRFAAAGQLLGTLLALSTLGFLRGMLYGVHPNDPAVLALVSAVLAGVVLATSYLPALRAGFVEPVEMLKAD
jgi:predicted permease